jgi:hypothetical protein
MKSFVAIALMSVLLAAPSQSLDSCQLTAEAVDLFLSQHLESAVNPRVKQTFDEVTKDGSTFCASGEPAVSLPLGTVDGVPSGVSGPARCALYCQNTDGCNSFNFLSTALSDGTQCQLFKTASTECAENKTGCRLFEATGSRQSCRKTSDFIYFPGSNAYYKPILESLNWDEAQDKCQEISPFSHLAVFDSMSEFDEVTNYLKTLPTKPVWDCTSNAGYSYDWAGYWVALRKLQNSVPTYAECKASKMFWALDTKLTELQPLQPWGQDMFINAAFPDCTAYYRKLYLWEMCMAIPVNHGYKLNDMMCDFKMAALCQLDI